MRERKYDDTTRIQLLHCIFIKDTVSASTKKKAAVFKPPLLKSLFYLFIFCQFCCMQITYVLLLRKGATR